MTERRCRDGTTIVVTIQEWNESGPTGSEIIRCEDQIQQCCLAKIRTENVTVSQRKHMIHGAGERYLEVTRTKKIPSRGMYYNIKWINERSTGKFEYLFSAEADRSEQIDYAHDV